jgi:hypothetical protein
VSEPVRRAGRARLDDGSLVTWSVADGRRGRRWRIAVEHDGSLVASTLLEVSTEGRLARLELATPAGLLTLHPEGSGGLHGNAVTRHGVRHIRFAWSNEHELAIDGTLIASAITAHRLARTTRTGEGSALRVVAVGVELSVRADARFFHRLAQDTWRIDGDTGSTTVAIDARGIPRWPGETDEWPLEQDSPR